MEANVLATVDKADGICNQPDQQEVPRKDIEKLSLRFRNALNKSVEGIIEAGQVLIEAKNRLPHGQYTDWVCRELRFGVESKSSSDAVIARQGQMLRMLAGHEVISNPCHWHALPPSIRTLYELTLIRPSQRLVELIKKKKIHAGMTREEAIALQPKAKRDTESKPKPKLKRPVVTLLKVCLSLGGADCVQAHIRSLREKKEHVSVQTFEQAVRWAKQELADQEGGK
jgi:hypothetical protein